MHTHSLTRALTHACTHSPVRIIACTRSHSHPHALTLTRPSTLTHTHMLSHSHALPHSLTPTCSHTHTPFHTHSHPHALSPASDISTNELAKSFLSSMFSSTFRRFPQFFIDFSMFSSTIRRKCRRQVRARGFRSVQQMKEFMRMESGACFHIQGNHAQNRYWQTDLAAQTHTTLCLASPN